MTLEEGKVKIEKFDGRDFSFWKMQIEDYLYQKKLYQPLSGVKPEDMKQEEWKLRRIKVKLGPRCYTFSSIFNTWKYIAILLLFL